MGIDNIDFLKSDSQVRGGDTVPVIRYYEVEQTRVVKVSANTELQAAVLADKAFNHEPWVAEPGIGVVEPVRVTRLDVSDVGI